MKEYFLTRDAEADLIEHWTYLGRDNLQVGDRFVDKVDALCEQLLEFPNLGRARHEFVGGYRSINLDNYLIFYRVLETKIEINRVLHGSVDLTQFFGMRREESG